MGCKFPSYGLVHVECIEKPVVWPVWCLTCFEFKCTQGMRYLLQAINETACVIISRVDAMYIQRARVFCKLYAAAAAFFPNSLAHLFKETQVFFNAAMPIWGFSTGG